MAGSPISVADLLGLPSVGRAISQHSNRVCTNQIPDAGTLIDAFRKGKLSEDQMRRGLKSDGYSDTAIDAMLASTETGLNEGQLIEGYNRGVISAEDIADKLRKKGYTEEAINGVLSLSKSIPRPSDSLYMYRQGKISSEELKQNLAANGMSDLAIDAFLEGETFHFPPATQAKIDMNGRMSDGTLQAIGISTEPSEAFIKACKSQGMTDDQTKALWIAEQPLPDNGTIIQQLHKGEISEETARDLLRGKGLSDAGVSELLAGQTTIIPSRTAGTMFMNRGMSSDDLKKTLMDNGYNEEDANKIVDYYQMQRDAKDAKAAEAAAKKATAKKTTAKGAAGGSSTAVKNKDLSLDLIKNAYYYHEIEAADAMGLIQELDYVDWEAALIMSIWDAQLVQKDTNDMVTVLADSYKNGLIDETALRDELGKLNLRAAAIEVVVAKNTQVKKSTQKHPSLADLKRWYKKDLITEDEFIEWLQKLNYPSDVAYIYFQEAGGVLTE